MLAVNADLEFPTESEHQALLQREHKILFCFHTLLCDSYQGLGAFPDVYREQDTYSEVNRADENGVEVEEREMRGDLRYGPEDEGLTDLLGAGDRLGDGAPYVVLEGESPLDLLNEI